METIINRFSSSNYKLCKDNVNEYFLIDKDNNDIIYSLRDWKFKGPDSYGVRYLKESTKTRLITECKARATLSHDIHDFVEWYNNIHDQTSPKIPDINLGEPKIINDINYNEIIKGVSDVIRDSNRDIVNAIKEDKKASIFEEAIINGIIDKAKADATEEIKNKVIAEATEYIDKTYGKLPQTIEIVQNNKSKQIEGVFHKEFNKILQIVGQKIPLMLIGPAGSGKNHTLEQIAEALDLDFYFTNSITQEYKLTGFIDANGTYHETEFYKAFKNGGLFFFDEIDASCAEALIIINAALANGYFDFPNGRINAHEDFRVVAAANTFGNGADMIYVGRNQLDGATLDRFATLRFEYDSDIEKSLCADDSLYEFIIDIRNAIAKRRLRFVVSMRATINASKMLKANIDKETILKTVVLKSMTKDDINTIINEIKHTNNEWFKVLYDKCI